MDTCNADGTHYHIIGAAISYNGRGQRYLIECVPTRPDFGLRQARTYATAKARQHASDSYAMWAERTST